MEIALDESICFINAIALCICRNSYCGRLDPEYSKNKLTFHPVINDSLSLFGRAFGKPVVTKQHRHLIGVDQFPRHECQRPKGNL